MFKKTKGVIREEQNKLFFSINLYRHIYAGEVFCLEL